MEWARVREAALALPDAKIVEESEGSMELQTSIGPYVQRIALRMDGTTLHALFKHQPGRKLFDFGASGKQRADRPAGRPGRCSTRRRRRGRGRPMP